LIVINDARNQFQKEQLAGVNVLSSAPNNVHQKKYW